MAKINLERDDKMIGEIIRIQEESDFKMITIVIKR